MRVQGVVAAQLREPWVPVDDLAAAVDALAPRDRGLEAVIDTLARDAAQPPNARTWPSRNASIVMSKEKCAVAAPENGSEQINA